MGQNKGENRGIVNLDDELKEYKATDNVTSNIQGQHKIYTHEFESDKRKGTRTQKRLIIGSKTLKEISFQYLNWNFKQEGWIIGEKIKQS